MELTVDIEKSISSSSLSNIGLPCSVFRMAQLCLKTNTTSVTHFQNRLMVRNMVWKYIMYVLQMFIKRTSIAELCWTLGALYRYVEAIYTFDFECGFKLDKVSTTKFLGILQNWSRLEKNQVPNGWGKSNKIVGSIRQTPSQNIRGSMRKINVIVVL